MKAESTSAESCLRMKCQKNRINLKTAVGGEFFLTQRRREAENAEKIANL